MSEKPRLKSALLKTRTALLVIAAGAVAARFAAAALRGDYLCFDESMYIMLGRSMLSGKGYVMNGLPNATFPYGISLVAGIGDALFGTRWALSVPSAVLGGVAVIPLYYLILRMTSRTAALTTAVLYAGFPSLLFFSPFAPYVRRIYEGSEQIYIFLTLTMAFFAYRAVAEGRWRDYVLAGIFAGAAFEVRQEAAVLCGFLALWMLAVAAWRRKLKDLVRPLGFSAAAFLVALPFAIHVHTVTGSFGPGLRLAGSLPMRDAFLPVVEKNDWSAALDFLFKLNEDGSEFEQPYYGVSDWHRSRLRSSAQDAGAMLSDLRTGYVPEALRLFLDKAVPQKLQFLLIVGCIALLVWPCRWLNLGFLLALAMPAAFLAMALFPLPRFSIYLAPYAVFLIASGICLVLEVAGMAVKRLAPYAPIAAAVIAVALALYGVRNSLMAQKAGRDNRRDYERITEELQKRAAQWLLVNTVPNATVMADSPQACVLANREWLALPRDIDSRVMKYAVHRKADFFMRVGGRDGRSRLMEPALVAVLSDYSGANRVSLTIYDMSKLGSERAGEGASNRFVLITVDTLRVDHMGCYGYSRNTTPSIDAFAREASVYTRAFSASSFTGPSVTSIHTSRYPGVNESNFANGYPVPPAPIATMAKVFDGARFRTAAFVGNSVLRKSAGLFEGFQLYDATFTSTELNRRNSERVASSLAPAALEWLAENAAEPFFLWIHFQDPHGPYVPPEPYASQFAWQSDRVTMLPVLNNISGYKGIPSYQSLSGRQELEYYISQYDGEIAFADEWIGTLFAKLRELGVWDSTVIALTADHGEAFGENDFYCAHGHWVGPELTHVPLVLRVPGAPAGSNDTPVSLVDVGPTLVDLAGLDIPESFMGKSLVRSAGSPARDRGFFIETPYAIAACDGRFAYTWGRALPNNSRPQNNKVTAAEIFDFEDSPAGLYEVSSDAMWQRDVKEANPREAAALHSMCSDHIAASAPFCDRIPVVSIDEDSRKALEALGYLNK